MKKFLLVLLVLSFIMAGVFGCIKPKESEELTKIRMAFIPVAGVTEEIEHFKPVVDYVAEYIGIEIEVIPVMDYAAVIIALKTNDVQMAKLGPFSYVLATTQTDMIEPIAKGVQLKTGKASYTSIFIAKADSGIKTIQDLKNKVFAFVDVGSSSGYLFPLAMLKKLEIEPETYFKKIFFSGSHPATIEAVVHGKVDAGCVAIQRYENAMNEGIFNEGDLVIIAESGPIPSSPIVIRTDLPDDLKEKIKEAWLTMPKEVTAHAEAKMSHYTTAIDADYDFLREVAEVLELDLTAKK